MFCLFGNHRGVRGCLFLTLMESMELIRHWKAQYASVHVAVGPNFVFLSLSLFDFFFFFYPFFIMNIIIHITL